MSYKLMNDYGGITIIGDEQGITLEYGFRVFQKTKERIIKEEFYGMHPLTVPCDDRYTRTIEVVSNDKAFKLLWKYTIQNIAHLFLQTLNGSMPERIKALTDITKEVLEKEAKYGNF